MRVLIQNFNLEFEMEDKITVKLADHLLYLYYL